MASSTTIENYHCNSCKNGIVSVKHKQTKNFITTNFGDCNCCKKPFGLKSIGQLRKVDNTFLSDGMKYYRQVMVNDRLPELGAEYISCFVSSTAGASTYIKVTEKVLEVLAERYTYWLEEI